MSGTEGPFLKDGHTEPELVHEIRFVFWIVMLLWRNTNGSFSGRQKQEVERKTMMF